LTGERQALPRAAASTNYRQLQLARGVRAVQETEEERAGRAQTRSEARLWYRQGGEAALESESATAALCSNWQQFHLMTRGRGEEREEGQLATPSERLHWYRQGGRHLVEARDNLARESTNWMQYKINRDKNEFSDSLEDNIHTKWSKFESKEQLKDYLAQQRTETMQERNAVRAMVAGKINKETVTKNAYEISKHSFDVEEIEEESRRRVAASLGAAERVAALRAVTEEMLTKQTEYSQSGRQLALQAYREQDQAAAASRSKRTTVVSSASVAA